MDVEQFKEEVRSGRMDADRLAALVLMLQRQLQQAREELAQAQRRIDELEKQQGGSPPTPPSEPYSVDAEEKRQQARGKGPRKKKGKRKRRGRLSSKQKIKRAQRVEKVFPEGVDPKDCRLSHTRPVWRLEKGQAVLVAYEVYRGPKSQYGKIPGVLGRSEFGIEIVLAIAYLVYIVGLSFDKVCMLLNFFQHLQLSKSQAEALLNQLARHWEKEFDTLCTLLAHSLVVHTDETGWSIHSVWAFLSEKVRVLFFGVHKDAATLEQILHPAAFEGIVISDDAAVYADFSQSQKCWAHLLRKAIKLTLTEPDNEEYRRFCDRLLEIYRKACRIQRDKRLSDAGRARKVEELDDEILELCGAVWGAELPTLEGPDNDYRLLCNELMRLMIKQQLFTFVTAAPVATPAAPRDPQPVGGTNNEAERTLRSPAATRDTGRANKTVRGARRQTIIVSVFESLRLYLHTFNLNTVIAEVNRWAKVGKSCFARLLTRMGLNDDRPTILDQLLPLPER